MWTSIETNILIYVVDPNFLESRLWHHCCCWKATKLNRTKYDSIILNKVEINLTNSFINGEMWSRIRTTTIADPKISNREQFLLLVLEAYIKVMKI